VSLLSVVAASSAAGAAGAAGDAEAPGAAAVSPPGAGTAVGVRVVAAAGTFASSA